MADADTASTPTATAGRGSPTPYLILYQTRAPLSLKNCPLRDHILRHIGLLYTGSATARRPTLPKQATVLTQCSGSVTTRTSPMPLRRAISATLRADSQVLPAVSSRRIAASGTPHLPQDAPTSRLPHRARVRPRRQSVRGDLPGPGSTTRLRDASRPRRRRRTRSPATQYLRPENHSNPRSPSCLTWD